jgi:hypothetical protein
MLDTGLKYGISASVAVYNHLRPWFSTQTLENPRRAPIPVGGTEAIEMNNP